MDKLLGLNWNKLGNGDNVHVASDGKMVYLAFDPTKDLGPSSSGKTNIIGTTGGNAMLSGLQGVQGVQVGLNVFKKK